MDAESGEIVTSDLTDKAVDDAAHVPVLLDLISTPIASFLGDGAFDTGAVYETVISRNPHARVIVPPGKDAVPSLNAEAAPTQRDNTFPGSGIVENLGDKARKLGIPVWKCGAGGA